MVKKFLKITLSVISFSFLLFFKFGNTLNLADKPHVIICVEKENIDKTGILYKLNKIKKETVSFLKVPIIFKIESENNDINGFNDNFLFAKNCVKRIKNEEKLKNLKDIGFVWLIAHANKMVNKTYISTTFKLEFFKVKFAVVIFEYENDELKITSVVYSKTKDWINNKNTTYSITRDYQSKILMNTINIIKPKISAQINRCRSPPRLLQNTAAKVSHCANYLVGEECKLQCSESNKAPVALPYCMHNGRWSGFVSCNIYKCHLPPKVLGEKSASLTSCKDTLVGGICLYECKNFLRKSNTIPTCDMSGNWDMDAECVLVLFRFEILMLIILSTIFLIGIFITVVLQIKRNQRRRLRNLHLQTSQIIEGFDID